MDIKLEPIDKVDINLLQKWQNDINIKYLTKGFRFPIQFKVVEDWLENLKKDNGSKRVVYGILVGNDAVGMASLHGIDYINSTAQFGIYVSEKKENNKGVGFSATSLLLDFAFNGMGLQRIELEVLCVNKNAIHLYKKIGFVEEGTKRSCYFIDGNYVDVKIMSILRSEFIFDKFNTKNRLVFTLSDEKN
ncbi:GNAT family N-acetyltransferase [Rhodobacteraceae bacterium]|nr:GNAT family N-acetyltransferase [Paracoccaceae bacterium]